VPPLLRAEIERESARLKLVNEQIRALEAARRQDIEDGKQPLVKQLAQLRAIGPKVSTSTEVDVPGARFDQAGRGTVEDLPQRP
jgi:hypothetical protein